jgi:hypothetical protein
VPRSIEVLKQKREHAVFRLNDMTANGGSVIAKRCRRTTGEVERVVYEYVLPRVTSPSLVCYGLVDEPGSDLCWLLLEDAGAASYLSSDSRHRVLAASWLAETHLAEIPVEISTRLPDRRLGHYLQLLGGCRTRLLDHLDRTPLSPEHTALFRRLVVFCDRVEASWGLVEKTCAILPRTLVHGDFVVKNLRLRGAARREALLVFDWQFAGWGIPATDLAQFIDRVASPDLDAYIAAMRRRHPHLREQDVRDVAACGNVLRVLDEIDWATLGLSVGDATSVVKAVALLDVYDTTIPDALRAFCRSCA